MATKNKQKKMRIGVYMSGIRPTQGGSFQYAQYILDALQPLQDEYEIIPIFATPLWEDILRREYDFTECHCVPQQYDIFAKSIDSLSCDLIICTETSDLAERVETPVLSIIHDLMHRYEPAFPEVAGQVYEQREHLYKYICEYSAGVFVDSEVGKRHAIESYGAHFSDNFYVQPFRVPNYLYDAVKNSTKESGRKKEKYIFYPAQFWKDKNHLNLFLAVRQLMDEGLDVKLICSGAAYNASKPLKKLMKRLELEDNITCMGYVSNEKICDLYRNARAMIMPSFYGPTNIPPLEAMFMGCPLAVSNVYAMPDQVGDAALLFDPKSVDAIADAIRRLWEDDDLCAELSRRGKARSALFSREKFNERFAKNLKAILAHVRMTSAWRNAFLEKCTSEHLYLYGTGNYSFLTAAFLAMHHVDIEGFLVTSADENPSEFLGRPVLVCDALDTKESPLVLVSLSKKYQEEVKDTLAQAGLTKRVFLEEADVSEIQKTFSTAQGQSFLRYVRMTGNLG